MAERAGCNTDTERTLTPCGARVCTGCATCVKAWASAPRVDLATWQAALVDRIYLPGTQGGDGA